VYLSTCAPVSVPEQLLLGTPVPVVEHFVHSQLRASCSSAVIFGAPFFAIVFLHLAGSFRSRPTGTTPFR
jgi:hypothetical protein